eukprot:4984128-Amphidinium_carterae.1
MSTNAHMQSLFALTVWQGAETEAFAWGMLATAVSGAAASSQLNLGTTFVCSLQRRQCITSGFA